MKDHPRLSVATDRQCNKVKHQRLGRIYALVMAFLLASVTLFITTLDTYGFFPESYADSGLIVLFLCLLGTSWLIFWQTEIIRKATTINDTDFAQFSTNLRTCLSIQVCRHETRWFIKEIEGQRRRPIVKEAEILEDFANHFKNLHWHEVIMTDISEKWKKAPPIFQDAA